MCKLFEAKGRFPIQILFYFVGFNKVGRKQLTGKVRFNLPLLLSRGNKYFFMLLSCCLASLMKIPIDFTAGETF